MAETPREWLARADREDKQREIAEQKEIEARAMREKKAVGAFEELLASLNGLSGNTLGQRQFVWSASDRKMSLEHATATLIPVESTSPESLSGVSIKFAGRFGPQNPLDITPSGTDEKFSWLTQNGQLVSNDQVLIMIMSTLRELP